ncbi:MAG: hypothetical protein JWN93_3949 [Hyphomicrobiales bacterium]|nr:hypothetical protein [Hyphomicrobiales bacterium]
MRLFALAIAAACLSAPSLNPASAQGRPDTTHMSCAQARGLVATRGAVVLGTGPSLYDRYVEHRGFCTPSEELRPAFVRSGDSPQCFVGYRCEEVINRDNR